MNSNDILADIRRAMNMLESMPPPPFLASCRMLPADKAMSFKCDGREYVGAHPDFWGTLPKTYRAEPDPLFSVQTAVARDYPFDSADSTSLAQNGWRYDSPMDELLGDNWRGRRAYADRLEGKHGEVSPARHVRTKAKAHHGAKAQPSRPESSLWDFLQP